MLRLDYYMHQMLNFPFQLIYNALLSCNFPKKKKKVSVKSKSKSSKLAIIEVKEVKLTNGDGTKDEFIHTVKSQINNHFDWFLPMIHWRTDA